MEFFNCKFTEKLSLKVQNKQIIKKIKNTTCTYGHGTTIKYEKSKVKIMVRTRSIPSGKVICSQNYSGKVQNPNYKKESNNV